MRLYFNKLQKGFSLVEVLVSLGILVTIITVVIANQSAYTDTAGIVNLADEISIALSQAQAYGTGVKELSPGSAIFSASYGLTFSLLSGGSNSSYLFFADRNANNTYDGDWACVTGGASECLEKTTIYRGNYIDSICVIRSGDADLCNSAMRVDINFVRPNTSSQLTLFNNNGESFTVPNTNGVRIVLKTPQGSSRSVLVYKSGQISVQ